MRLTGIASLSARSCSRPRYAQPLLRRTSLAQYARVRQDHRRDFPEVKRQYHRLWRASWMQGYDSYPSGQSEYLLSCLLIQIYMNIPPEHRCRVRQLRERYPLGRVGEFLRFGHAWARLLRSCRGPSGREDQAVWKPRSSSHRYILPHDQ